MTTTIERPQEPGADLPLRSPSAGPSRPRRLSSAGQIFRAVDVRNRIHFTLGVIAIYTLGANLPVPGIDLGAVRSLNGQSKSAGVLGYLNLFSGGALTRFAVFGLGILPYITSSIIVQLLGGVIPRFKEWRDEGALGQRHLTQATRYLTVALALLQSTGLAYAFHNGGSTFLGAGVNVDLIPKFTVPRVALVVLTLTAGTALVMWLAELITQRGIGQGASILIFTNVVAGIPAGMGSILATGGKLKFGVVLGASVLLVLCVVIVELGQRRIPVSFAKRVVGRRMYDGQRTYVPLKVNQAGVVPIIFASSLLYVPVLLSNVVPWRWFQGLVNNDLAQPTSLSYVLIFGGLIVLFAYFYTTVQFDPHRQADLIRAQGGYIPGIRPGPPSERYLARTLHHLTLPGSVFLAAVALVPSIVLALWKLGSSFPFAGVSLLIAVGVSLETVRQINSQLLMRNYSGFLE